MWEDTPPLSFCFVSSSMDLQDNKRKSPGPPSRAISLRNKRGTGWTEGENKIKRLPSVASAFISYLSPWRAEGLAGWYLSFIFYRIHHCLLLTFLS